jgi:ABC-type antimicrobial peptide transport system permease subunit
VVRLAARRTGDPGVIAPVLHDSARIGEPAAQVQWTFTLEQQLEEPVTVYRMLGGVVLALGAVALLLAGTGIHALMAFSVTQRRRELAVRVALGASPARVAAAVVRRAAAELGAGAIAGIALAILFDRLLRILPFALERSGPGAMAGILIVLGAAAFAACAGPVRRALRISPAEGLHDLR